MPNTGSGAQLSLRAWHVPSAGQSLFNSPLNNLLSQVGVRSLSEAQRG